jgi:hypothetical protein
MQQKRNLIKNKYKNTYLRKFYKVKLINYIIKLGYNKVSKQFVSLILYLN